MKSNKGNVSVESRLVTTLIRYILKGAFMYYLVVHTYKYRQRKRLLFAPV